MPFYSLNSYTIRQFGVTHQNQTKKILQLVQNFAGKIVLGLGKFDHISQGLKSLRWLCIEDKLLLNTAVTVHKCLNHQVPDYLNDKFLYRSQVHNRQLRSVVNNDLNLHIVGFLVAEVICFPRSKTLNCSRSFWTVFKPTVCWIFRRILQSLNVRHIICSFLNITFILNTIFPFFHKSCYVNLQLPIFVPFQGAQ